MLQRYLLVSNRLTMSSSKFIDDAMGAQVIELLLPMTTFKVVDQLLAQADFLSASDGYRADINSIYRRVFREVAQYARKENDRIWLHRSGKEPAQRI